VACVCARTRDFAGRAFSPAQPPSSIGVSLAVCLSIYLLGSQLFNQSMPVSSVSHYDMGVNGILETLSTFKLGKQPFLPVDAPPHCTRQCLVQAPTCSSTGASTYTNPSTESNIMAQARSSCMLPWAHGGGSREHGVRLCVLGCWCYYDCLAFICLHEVQPQKNGAGDGL